MNMLIQMTGGGTESLILAVKTYRDKGKADKGITKPNVVLCVSHKVQMKSQIDPILLLS